jgi:phytoene dehydrogenase-like protein
MKIVIVGAGLAGLTCAKVVRERGAEVAVFEASDDIGGRVRTDERDGYLLDRGFQVYFTSYPVARRHLDYGGLDFRDFDPGAIVCRGPEKSVLSDPLRDPKALVPSLLSDAATVGDKLRTLDLAARSVRGGISAGAENGEAAGVRPLRALHRLVFQAGLRRHSPEPRAGHERPSPTLYPQDAGHGSHGRARLGHGRDTTTARLPTAGGRGPTR